MAVVKVTSGANAGKYAATNKDGVKQYFSSQSAGVAYAKTGGSSSSSSSSGSSSSGSSSGSSSSGSSSAIDYTKSANETIAEYNARIAAARGDSPEELASMQAKAAALPSTPTESVATTVAKSQAMLEQTKAQGSTPFAGSVFEQAYLQSPEAPLSPTQITQLKSVTAPTLDSTVVNPAGAVAVSDGMKTYMEAIQKQLEQQQARTDKLAKENQTLSEKYLGTMKNPEDVYNQAWEDTGMSAKEYFATQESGIKQIESLNNEYATVKGAMEQQIAQTGDKMASMNFINNQTAQIRRNAEPQLNTLSAQISSKAATLQALQGNFAEARSLVNDAVNAATAGNKFKADMYSAFYEQNVDNFNRVEKNYSEAFQNAMNIALDDYKMQREEKMQIGELMLKYPSAGIDMNGTLDEAFQRAGLVAPTGSGDSLTADMKNYNMAVQTGYKGTFADFLGKNGGSTVSNFDDVMQQSIDAGATPEQAAREAATASELAGIPVDQKTLASWTENARRMSPTPEPAPFSNQTISAPTGNETKATTSSGPTLKSIWASIFD